MAPPPSCVEQAIPALAGEELDSSQESSRAQQGHQRPLLETLLPGWAVTLASVNAVGSAGEADSTPGTNTTLCRSWPTPGFPQVAAAAVPPENLGLAGSFEASLGSWDPHRTT